MYEGQDSNLGVFNFEAYAVCIWKGGSWLCVLPKSHSAEALLGLLVFELGELHRDRN